MHEQQGVKVEPGPLVMSGTVKIDLDNRIVAFPVRRKLDLTVQTVVLPLHLLKALTAQIMTAEAQAERSTLEQMVRPAMAKVPPALPDVATPA